MRILRGFALAIAAAALAAGPALAQVQIDKRRPVSKAGQARLENAFGSVKVIGWDRDEIHVTGHLAPGAEGLDFGGDKDEAWIGVDTPEAWHYESGDDTEYRSDLEIHAPKGWQIEMETTNASVSVEAMEGPVTIETVNGALSVTGAPRAVEIRSITGKVEVLAGAAPMQIHTVSGEVSLRGAAREVAVRTVTGSVSVQGKALESVEVETTSGDVQLDGDFAKEGGLSVETHSGQVTLLVPATVAARFRLTTFSGQIQSELGPKPRKTERISPYLESRFSTGENEFDVEVRSFSGTILLKVNRAAAEAP